MIATLLGAVFPKWAPSCKWVTCKWVSACYLLACQPFTDCQFASRCHLKILCLLLSGYHLASIFFLSSSVLLQVGASASGCLLANGPFEMGAILQVGCYCASVCHIANGCPTSSGCHLASMSHIAKVGAILQVEAILQVKTLLLVGTSFCW